jgi:hypothetical protein
VNDDFAHKLDELVDYYLSVACPCRFPRFRAVVSRDTSRKGGGSFASDDQQGLIHAYERKVPLTDKRPLQGWGGPVTADMYQATCGICGSDVQRSSNEGAPGGWVDYLVIHLAPGVQEAGAPVERGSPVYRGTPFRATGPGSTGMQQATEAFPMLDPDAWFAWMRELGPGVQPKPA